MEQVNLKHGRISMDLERMEVRLRGREVHLGHTDFMVLRALLLHRGAVVSPAAIRGLGNKWPKWDRHDETLAVESAILRIRKQVGARAIRTVWKCGYRVEG